MVSDGTPSAQNPGSPRSGSAQTGADGQRTEQSVRRRRPGQDTVLRAGLRIALPAVWLGLLIGISFLEAPLKFQAPGITIPLGLGIGRLVFTAMNITEIVIALVLLWAVLSPGVHRLQRWTVCGLLAVLALKVAAIRPPLNARTDRVLAGVDDGGSSWHYLYITADCLLLIGVIVLIVAAVCASVRPTLSSAALAPPEALSPPEVPAPPSARPPR